MKKKYLAVSLAAVMAFGLFAGCADKNPGPGPGPGPGPDTPGGDVHVSTEAEEKTPIVFAIDGMDGVYSPFFATAAYDSEISGQTQIGMLNSENGNYVYGDDEACVVKDLNIKYLDGTQQNEVVDPSDAAYTQYNFLIKKGIKFSDGEDLTIDDVLFNMYVYLDPSYTGSSTMYSTDIVGLEDYRSQGGGTEEDLNNTAAQKAEDRLDRIYDWCNDRYIDYDLNGKPNNVYQYSGMTEAEREETEEDIRYFLENYDTELNSAYDAAVSGFDESRKTYMFEKGEYWQYFLFQYGLVNYKMQPGNQKPLKDFVILEDPENGDYVFADDSVTEEDVKKNIYEVYVFDFENDGQNKQMKEEAAACKTEDELREWALEKAYISTVGIRDDEENGNPDFDNLAFDYLAFASTALGSSTTNTLYSYILSDEISKLVSFQGKEITGIKTSKVNTFEGEDGKSYELDGEYDVLTILINKVDPKAIWNFAFTVAPQHYYAPTEEAKRYESDDHPIINGVVFNSSDFMNNVLKNSQRQRVPVGAGPYKASTSSGLSANQKYPTPGQFESVGRVYYERNTYFDLLDGVENGGPIQNARIKYLQYQKINSNVMLQSLQSRTIDVGTPNCTSDNINALNSISYLKWDKTRTNGYGYVGINAGKEEVSNVWVRRAIMKAMNIDLINTYFGAGNSEPIYRPMSLESWAYPPDSEGGKTPYSFTTDGITVDYSYDKTGDQILDMLRKAGFEISSDGKVLADNNGNPIQPIKFTVAGESTDHPAWQVFQQAKEILNGIGFEISVVTNASALSELTRGGLTVWAAAWSSTIDPDMYQVYHMNSTAGSTVNWGYNEIKKDHGSGGKYEYEYGVIEELSELIDEAREVLDEKQRRQYYWDALDLVMELAVEFPLYQRYDLTVYNGEKIDGTTLNQNPNAYDSLFNKIWEVGYNADYKV